MRILMKKVNEKGNPEKIYQFNRRYGASVVTDMFDSELGPDFTIHLIRFESDAPNGYVNATERYRLALSKEEVNEALLHLDTLVNTMRLVDALKGIGKWNLFDDIEFNAVERVSYDPRKKKTKNDAKENRA